MATYSEQIAAFEATRAAKAAELKSLMDASADEGETLDAEGQEQFDTVESEIEAIDKHLARLRKMKALDEATAKPVEGGSQKTGSESRVTTVAAKPRVSKSTPGVMFARLARVKALARPASRFWSATAARCFIGCRRTTWQASRTT